MRMYIQHLEKMGQLTTLAANSKSSTPPAKKSFFKKLKILTRKNKNPKARISSFFIGPETSEVEDGGTKSLPTSPAV